MERAAATSHDCIDTVVQVIRDQVAAVFAGVREQAPDAAIGALTAYDSWLGGQRSTRWIRGMRRDLYDAVRYWLHEWRSAMCEEADAVGAVAWTSIRTSRTVGKEPPTDFVGADYTHPSQEGNDVIRDLLIEANLPGPS